MLPVQRLLIIALLLLAGTVRSAVIEQFTPTGAQTEMSQVRAVFSAALVPLGRPEAAAPFEVHCTVTGRGRWADERTWIYDLGAPLPGGVKCGFRLRPGLVALNREPVQGEPEYGFSVPGPRLVSSLPEAGSTCGHEKHVPKAPRFVLNRVLALGAFGCPFNAIGPGSPGDADGHPSVALDADGKAEVAVPLNDNLTAFRIAAVATGEDRFGTGQARIASTQDLQIVSGLAPMVRQGDRAPAYFTVRNGSDRAMRVEVAASLSGMSAQLPVHSLDLAAGEAKEIGLALTVPEDASRLAGTVEAREAGGQARDSLKATQRVEPVLPVRVQSSALYRLDKQMDLGVAPPEGAQRGDVRATLAASLTDGQGTLRDHMRAYPYACLEQKVSRAVVLQDRQAWDALMQDLPAQLDESGLARFFPGPGRGDVALTAYVLAIAHAAGWPLPADARARMLKALEDYVTGRLDTPERPWLDARARLALRLNALEALARHGRATPELVSTVRPEPETWPTTALVDWLGLLLHSPALPGRDALLNAAQVVLKARMYYTGRRLTFGREAQDLFWWMLASPDTNAVRGLLAVMELPQWKAEVSRLVLGISHAATGTAPRPTPGARWPWNATPGCTRRYGPTGAATPGSGATAASSTGGPPRAAPPPSSPCRRTIRNSGSCTRARASPMSPSPPWPPCRSGRRCSAATASAARCGRWSAAGPIAGAWAMCCGYA